MRYRIFLLALITLLKGCHGACPCDGIVLSESDQNHCWQLEPRDSQTWTSGDEACQKVGGHLGHPDISIIPQLQAYIKQNTDKSVMTGVVAGNVEIPVYARMCPSNEFYNVMVNSSSSFSNTATSNQTCAFISSSSTEMFFQSCTTDALVMCDRPLDQLDYCSVMANCTTSSTSLLTTLFSTTTVALPTNSSSSISPSSTISSSDSTYNYSTSTIVTTSPVIYNSTSVTVTTVTIPAIPTASNANNNNNIATNNPATAATTTTTAPAAVSCTNTESCLKNQWKIFGMCIDWRAMLALILLGLLLMCCCWLCHCCLNACMWCTPKKKEKKDADKTEVLPPQAIYPDPVIITVPEKRESVYGFHTKEVIHVMPEKPETREIGINTDPIVQEVAIVEVPVTPPVIKKKKIFKKPKKMFIPSTIAPMDDIDEDIAAEVPLDVRSDSPGAKSIAPMGDQNIQPLSFVRNAKPQAPEPKSVGEMKEPARPPLQAPKRPNENGFDPSRIESPPPAADGKQPPKRMTFSPIADDSDDEPPMNSIPSPPPHARKSLAKDPNISPVPLDDAPVSRIPPNDPKPQQPLRNKRLGDPADGPNNNGSSASPASNNPFASLGSSSSPAPSSNNGNLFNKNSQNVAMRAARGALGGAVKGGGGGGDAPTAWKPWANRK